MYSTRPMPGPSSGNPITPQSVTVLNATYDRYFSNFRKRKANLIHVGGSNEDADYDIFPREACALHILPTARPPLGALAHKDATAGGAHVETGLRFRHSASGPRLRSRKRNSRVYVCEPSALAVGFKGTLIWRSARGRLYIV